MQRGWRSGARLFLADFGGDGASPAAQPCSARGRSAPRCNASPHATQRKAVFMRAVRRSARSAFARPHFLATKSGKQSANAALGCLLSLCSFSFDSEEVQMKGCRQILHCAAHKGVQTQRAARTRLRKRGTRHSSRAQPAAGDAHTPSASAQPGFASAGCLLTSRGGCKARPQAVSTPPRGGPGARHARRAWSGACPPHLCWRHPPSPGSWLCSSPSSARCLRVRRTRAPQHKRRRRAVVSLRSRSCHRSRAAAGAAPPPMALRP